MLEIIEHRVRPRQPDQFAKEELQRPGDGRQKLVLGRGVTLAVGSGGFQRIFVDTGPQQ